MSYIHRSSHSATLCCLCNETARVFPSARTLLLRPLIDLCRTSSMIPLIALDGRVVRMERFNAVQMQMLLGKLGLTSKVP